MIIADGTVFAAALEGRSDITALLADLWRRRALGAPPAVFGDLLAHERSPRRAERLRAWATDAPPLTEGPNAWTAAGDVVALLGERDLQISLVDGLVLAMCAREAARLWTLNPTLTAACEVVPIERYSPGGLE